MRIDRGPSNNTCQIYVMYKYEQSCAAAAAAGGVIMHDNFMVKKLTEGHTNLSSLAVSYAFRCRTHHNEDWGDITITLTDPHTAEPRPTSPA